ncbi:hypothetical protein LDC_2123 [sediment metagenome]|uniref:Uncharacterized protein n=1 Tax=sediment metagenome TaxID=749907 RepID=D9PKQ4_9ZZZZ
MTTDTPSISSRFTVVGSIDLGMVPGTSPVIRLTTLIQRASGHGLSVSWCGRGVYKSDLTVRERSRTVGCRPPKADDPTGLALNIYDEEVYNILKGVVSQTTL